MDTVTGSALDLSGRDGRDRASRALDGARSGYYERPSTALRVAAACLAYGRSAADPTLRARATALQGIVSLHRGDLRGALVLAIEAERDTEATPDLAARSETAALRGQVSFFAGSHAEALSSAQRAVDLADASRELSLRIYARRAGCLVFGNLGVADLRDRLNALLELCVESGDAWEQAVSRNDLACFLAAEDPAAAAAEIERALRCARELDGENRFALGVIHSTRADIRLAADRPGPALGDARRAISLLTAGGDPNPYVLAATVRAEVQARMMLGQLEGARESGEGALHWLGDRVPQMRSLILSTLAEELRAAGRVEEAYDALARSAALERQAFQELSELQLSLERTMLETTHLREQAERDWLTGLRNRRYLARALETGAAERLEVPLAVAALDLDHFKAVNDGFGHAVGDQVLVHVARRLSDVLRERDVVVRNGGEEFLVLMPATGSFAAAVCAERIRRTVQDIPWETVADGLQVTVSVGLAVAQAPSALDAVLSLADERLYAAKRRGRNRVVGEDPLTPEAPSAPGDGAPAADPETPGAPARSGSAADRPSS